MNTIFKCSFTLLLITTLAIILLSCGKRKTTTVESPGHFYVEYEYIKEGKNTILDGYYKHFRSDGKIVKSMNYTNNVLNGSFLEYNPDNGILIDSYSYKMGKVVGLRKKWYSDGAQKCELNFSENSELEGDQVWYHSNGRVALAAKAIGDNFTGPVEELDENGNVIVSHDFKGTIDNKLIGKWLVEDSYTLEFLPDNRYVLIENGTETKGVYAFTRDVLYFDNDKLQTYKFDKLTDSSYVMSKTLGVVDFHGRKSRDSFSGVRI
ncbi:MAG: hypothetical protein HOP30_04795 [Cyclobacteriaceae bacterium]|nr:hypothetical protein [Cyclobacteriaceae bacterium]